MACLRWWREGVRRRSRGRSGPRHGGGASSRLALGLDPRGSAGRDRFPARPAGRAKEGKEGRPDRRSVGSDAPRARRLGPWPRASALRTCRPDALSACAQPRHRCRDGRGRRPSRVTRLFASGSDRRRTLDTALRERA